MAVDRRGGRVLGAVWVAVRLVRAGCVERRRRRRHRWPDRRPSDRCQPARRASRRDARSSASGSERARRSSPDHPRREQNPRDVLPAASPHDTRAPPGPRPAQIAAATAPLKPRAVGTDRRRVTLADDPTDNVPSAGVTACSAVEKIVGYADNLTGHDPPRTVVRPSQGDNANDQNENGVNTDLTAIATPWLGRADDRCGGPRAPKSDPRAPATHPCRPLPAVKRRRHVLAHADVRA